MALKLEPDSYFWFYYSVRCGKYFISNISCWNQVPSISRSSIFPLLGVRVYKEIFMVGKRTVKQKQDQAKRNEIGMCFVDSQNFSWQSPKHDDVVFFYISWLRADLQCWLKGLNKASFNNKFSVSIRISPFFFTKFSKQICRMITFIFNVLGQTKFYVIAFLHKGALLDI